MAVIHAIDFVLAVSSAAVYGALLVIHRDERQEIIVAGLFGALLIGVVIVLA